MNNFDPERLTKETVQIWSASGKVVHSYLSLIEAQSLVRKRKAFIINEGVIELVNRKSR